MDNLDGASLDVERMEREKLRAVFPECFAEGKLNVKKLLALCGEYDDNDFEKYKFEWKGKDASLRLAQQRSMATLRPCRAESVAWDTTQNLYLEGDNLEVLKLLQTAYYRRVKMIYIDPPYNTGNDFVYEDDFADPIQKYKEVTSQTTRSNPETMGRFHTNWLNMMYPRLRLAANLLRDDGVIFISIDDNEVDNLKKVCNEVFGEENFIAQIIVQTNPRGRTFDRFIAKTHEYILVYSKNIDLDGIYYIPKDEKAIADYSKEDESGKYRLLELRNRNPVFNRSNRPLMFYPFYADPDKLDVSLQPTERHTIEIYPRNSQGEDGCWTWGQQKAKNDIALLVANLAKTGKWTVFRKDYLEGTSLCTKCKALWLDKEMNHENGKEIMGQLFGKTPFDFPKSVDYIKKCVQLGTYKDSNDIILDFFSGSATTAHAVMQLNKDDGGNRRFIMVQLPELTDEKSEAYKAGYKNICEIGKERIRRAGRVISEKKVISDQWLVDSEKKVVSGKKVISGQWLVDSENTGVSGQGLGESEKTGDLFADEKLTTNHSSLTTMSVDSENTGVSGQGLGESEKTGDLFADEKLTTNHSSLTTMSVDSEKKVVSDQWTVDSEKKVMSEKTGDLFADEKLTTNHSSLTTKETTNHSSLITNHSNHLPLTTTNPDTGFRVFKLDTSNLRTWDATPVDSDDPQQMELLLDRMHSMVETIKSDRSDEDVVYELMLKMGVPPTYSVTPVQIDGKRAYCIGEECLLLVCLQEGLTAATIERMAEEWMPSKMLVSEKCFADDTAIANAHYILRDRGIELKLV